MAEIQLGTVEARFADIVWKMKRETYFYGDGANPVILKSEFIISLCDQLIGGSNPGAKQKSIITNAEAGHGLIKVGSSLVPFANKFPKNTSLYKLMTTKPGESS